MNPISHALYYSVVVYNKSEHYKLQSFSMSLSGWLSWFSRWPLRRMFAPQSRQSQLRIPSLGVGKMRSNQYTAGDYCRRVWRLLLALRWTSVTSFTKPASSRLLQQEMSTCPVIWKNGKDIQLLTFNWWPANVTVRLKLVSIELVRMAWENNTSPCWEFDKASNAYMMCPTSGTIHVCRYWGLSCSKRVQNVALKKRKGKRNSSSKDAEKSCSLRQQII